MSDKTKKIALLENHWGVPSELLTAEEGFWDPMGPDPDLLLVLAEMAGKLAADAQEAGLTSMARLAAALTDVTAGFAHGTIDPTGPASGLFVPAVEALEDAFVLLEAGETPADSELDGCSQRLSRAMSPAQGEPRTMSPAQGEPRTMSPAQGEPRTESPAPEPSITHWGPWEPPYPDMEDDYLAEVQTHVDNLQAGIIKLSTGKKDEELINDLFRSSHSIKGQSGQMAAQPLEKVAHKLEDILDLVRQGTLALSPQSTESLLGAIDALAEILEQLKETRHVACDLDAVMASMERLIRGEVPPPPTRAPDTSATVRPDRPQIAQKEPKKQAPRPGKAAEQKAGASRPQGSPKARAQYLRVDFAKVDQVMNLVGDLFINKIKLHHGVHALDELHLQVARLQSILGRQAEAGTDGIALSEEESRRLMGDIAALASGLETLSDRLGAATDETSMISQDLRDHVMVMRMVPLDSLFGRLSRVVFDAVQKECRGHGPGWKSARLEIVGADAEIDKVIANVLEVPLVHIVRNAVAHGIEPAFERESLGKEGEGWVRVTAGQQGSQFVIQVEDDGRGMVPAVMGEVALKKGIVTEDELSTMSDKEMLGLIFRPGFTTAETADDLKGRGVGLDEVMSKINQVKGSIEVESEVGQGSKVTLALPLTLAINTVIIGEVFGETLALPMSVVERVVKVAERDVEHMGDAEVFTLSEKTVPLVRADALLSLGRPPAQRPDATYVVVMNVGNKRFGLALDKMRGKEDVVVKSLGTLIVEAPLVAGATLLGEKCILILDPVDIAANLGRGQVRGSRRAAPKGERIRPKLLLVDDDSTARIRLRRIFEDAGFEVHEASDGQLALDAAASSRFQMVSTDVVMPRMDGYELTRKLRKLPAYQEVPILMISSKAGEVDKGAGFDAGVDYYLAKPVERSVLIELLDEVRL